MLVKLKRIKQYLDNRAESISVFDDLLDDYLSGGLESYFSELGLSNVNIFIDWQTNSGVLNYKDAIRKIMLICKLKKTISE